jgi:hypothetical protein
MELNKRGKGVCSVNRERNLLDFQTRSTGRQGLTETYVEHARVCSATETTSTEPIPVVSHGLCGHKRYRREKQCPQHPCLE